MASNLPLEELVEVVERVQEFLEKYPETESLRHHLEKAMMGVQVCSLIPVAQQVAVIAKDTAKKLKKEVQVKSNGFDFEVSHSLREALFTALLHAIRNSIAHGIEFPADRKKGGKSIAGEIQIKNSIENAHLKLYLTDDGRILDLDGILQKSIEQKIYSTNQIQNLKSEPDKILELLFFSGFSTSQTVDDFSGRGMGLDAVRSALNKVDGRVSAHLTAHGGFELRMIIPLACVGLLVVPVRMGSYNFWIQKDDYDQISRQLSGKCEEIGLPIRKLFRRLDPIWKTAGPPWMKFWLEASAGAVLASKMSGGAIAILAELPILLQLLHTPRLFGPHNTL